MKRYILLSAIIGCIAGVSTRGVPEGQSYIEEIGQTIEERELVPEKDEDALDAEAEAVISKKELKNEYDKIAARVSELHEEIKALERSGESGDKLQAARFAQGKAFAKMERLGKRMGLKMKLSSKEAQGRIINR